MEEIYFDLVIVNRIDNELLCLNNYIYGYETFKPNNILKDVTFLFEKYKTDLNFRNNQNYYVLIRIRKAVDKTLHLLKKKSDADPVEFTPIVTNDTSFANIRKIMDSYLVSSSIQTKTMFYLWVLVFEISEYLHVTSDFLDESVLFDYYEIEEEAAIQTLLIETEQTNLINEPETEQKTPYKIALLHEIGFFKLDAIKKLTKENQYKVISTLTGGTHRTIKGNVNVLDPNSNEDRLKYTSNNYTDEVKNYLDKLK